MEFIQQDQDKSFKVIFQTDQQNFKCHSNALVELSVLKSQLTNKVQGYKQLQMFKQKLLQRIKKLKQKKKQLETSAKALSDSPKKRHPLFIVRPSFLAQKFISKQIKSYIIQLGQKFNKLNRFQQNQLERYLTKHKQSNNLIKEFLKLFKQKWRLDKQALKRINEQALNTSEQKLKTQQLQKYKNKLQLQIEYLIQLKKPQKQLYDKLTLQISESDANIQNTTKLLQDQKDKYLNDFNIMVCRQRLHTQFNYATKTAKISGILNSSYISLEKQRRRKSTLQKSLKQHKVSGIFGLVVSLKRRQTRGISVELKTHQKRITSKTEYTQSTALKTRQSMIL